MDRRKTAALVAAGLVVGLALGSVGIATAASRSSATTDAALGRGPGTGPVGGFGGRMGGGMMRGGGLIQALAKLTGLTEAEVRAQRESGKSLTAIAKTEGVRADKVIELALKNAGIVLDAQVKVGAITVAEKTRILSELQARFSDEMTHTGRIPQRGFGMRGVGMRGGGLIEAVAELTGLTEAEVRAKRESGKSLTEIAKAEGVDADVVVAEALERATTRLDAEVKAGRITAEEKKRFLADLKIRLADMVTHTGQMEHGVGFGRRGFGRGPGSDSSTSTAPSDGATTY